MRKYETTFIIDGLLNDADREAIIQRFEDLLKKNGVELDRIVRWGRRQLAYEIKKRTHGYYVIFYYTASPVVISTFHRELDINEYILRYMTLLSDGKHPEYIRDEGVPADLSSSSQQSSVISESIDETEGESLEVEIDLNDEVPAGDESQQEIDVDEERTVDSDSEVTGEDETGNDSDELNNTEKDKEDD